jgi:hypothetical protein
LVHLASFLFFILLVLQNVNELPSSPLLRGGKGNNLFLSTKTFSGFYSKLFSGPILFPFIIQTSFVPNPPIPKPNELRRKSGCKSNQGFLPCK